MCPRRSEEAIEYPELVFWNTVSHQGGLRSYEEQVFLTAEPSHHYYFYFLRQYIGKDLLSKSALQFMGEPFKTQFEQKKTLPNPVLTGLLYLDTVSCILGYPRSLESKMVLYF